MHFAPALVIVPFLLVLSMPNAVPGMPMPPCGNDNSPEPAYSALDQPPEILLETDKARLNTWVPADCLGWQAEPADIVVAIAGRARAETIDEFLARMAHVSDLEEIVYWSITRQAWRPLFDRAAALSAADNDAERPDFSVDEFAADARFYAVHDDNDVMGPVVHQMDVRELSENRLVIATRNVGPGRVFGINVLQPGGLENVTIIQHEAGNIWLYYAVTRLRARIPGWMLPPEAAYINRMVAFYRYMTGLPTESEPPAARHADDVPG